MNAIDHDLKWTRPLVRRNGPPPADVHHHTAGSNAETIEQIHAAHIRRGMSGCGYHYVVYRDGSIHRGRPEWAMGGHTYRHGDCLGICAVGNYDKLLNRMPAAQRNSIRQLTQDIKRRYPVIRHRRHRDMSSNATACPGRNYPFSYVTAPAIAVVRPAQYPALKRAMVRYAKAARPPIPGSAGVNFLPVWGRPARTLAWYVSTRIHASQPSVPQTTKPTRALYDSLLG